MDRPKEPTSSDDGGGVTPERSRSFPRGRIASPGPTRPSGEDGEGPSSQVPSEVVAEISDESRPFGFTSHRDVASTRSRDGSGGSGASSLSSHGGPPLQPLHPQPLHPAGGGGSGRIATASGSERPSANGGGGAPPARSLAKQSSWPWIDGLIEAVSRPFRPVEEPDYGGETPLGSRATPIARRFEATPEDARDSAEACVVNCREVGGGTMRASWAMPADTPLAEAHEQVGARV